MASRIRSLGSALWYRIRSRFGPGTSWRRYGDETPGNRARSGIVDVVILTDGATRFTRGQASRLAAAIETTASSLACGPVVEGSPPGRVVAAGYERGLDGATPVAIPLLAGEAVRRRWAVATTRAASPSGGVYAVEATLLDSIVAEVGPAESAIVQELRRRGPWTVVWAAAHSHSEDDMRGHVDVALERRSEGLGEVARVEPPGAESPGTPCPPPAALWVGASLHRQQAGLDRHDLTATVSIRHAATDWGVAENWGDHHFATALSDAFAAIGVGARVVPRHAWAHPFAARDLVITIRGLAKALPVVDRTNVLWVISHPTDIHPDELDGYDLVAVASELDRDRIAGMTETPVISLLQATEFSHLREPASGDGRVVFIGNSRGVRRRLVDWAIAEHIELDLYGEGWDDLEANGVFLNGSVDRETAATIFNSASVVLGDHWDDMRELGYVSNRVFDVAAAGGLLISDRVEGIDQVMPGTLTVSSSEELGRMVRDWLSADPLRRQQRVAEAQSLVRERHTFDRRVQELLAAIRDHVPASGRLADGIADT